MTPDFEAARLAAERRYREMVVFGTLPIATPHAEESCRDFPTFAARTLACVEEIWPCFPTGRLDAAKITAFLRTGYLPVVAAGQIVEDPERFFAEPHSET